MNRAREKAKASARLRAAAGGGGAAAVAGGGGVVPAAAGGGSLGRAVHQARCKRKYIRRGNNWECKAPAGINTMGFCERHFVMIKGAREKAKAARPRAAAEGGGGGGGGGAGAAAAGGRGGGGGGAVDASLNPPTGQFRRKKKIRN